MAGNETGRSGGGVVAGFSVLISAVAVAIATFQAYVSHQALLRANESILVAERIRICSNMAEAVDQFIEAAQLPVDEQSAATRQTALDSGLEGIRRANHELTLVGPDELYIAANYVSIKAQELMPAAREMQQSVEETRIVGQHGVVVDVRCRRAIGIADKPDSYGAEQERRLFPNG